MNHHAISRAIWLALPERYTSYGGLYDGWPVSRPALGTIRSPVDSALYLLCNAEGMDGKCGESMKPKDRIHEMAAPLVIRQGDQPGLT